MARNTTIQVAEVCEMCEGACSPYVPYLEKILIENLRLSDFHDRQVVGFATITRSVVFFPV